MKQNVKLVSSFILIVLIFVGVLFAANSLSDNPALLETIADFGYVGVLVTAIIAGLNTFVPLPAATFTTLFLNSGLDLYLIIVVLALGTLIADFIGFMLGYISRDLVLRKYPKIYSFATNIQENKQHLIIPVVILYAAFVPFPNEAILIPLALAGTSFKTLLLPLIIGNIIHQVVLIYSIGGISNFLF
jgi:membrane protein YqaA with SNARE-associated domain